MHNFCGGCISDWINGHTDCPICAKSIVILRKNDAINSILESFLENNPMKKFANSYY